MWIIEFIICWSPQILPGSEWTLHSWQDTTRGGQSASLWRCWAWQKVVHLFLWDAPSTWHNTDRGTATHLSLLYYLQNSTIIAASATVRTAESITFCEASKGTFEDNSVCHKSKNKLWKNVHSYQKLHASFEMFFKLHMKSTRNEINELS